jgi:hypothetical protein
MQRKTPAGNVKLKRAYEAPAADDGTRREQCAPRWQLFPNQLQRCFRMPAQIDSGTVHLGLAFYLRRRLMHALAQV